MNKNFFPTPVGIIKKMCDDIDWESIRTVLEPSAGKGDIADYIKRRWSSALYNHKEIIDIDCIELEPDLISILKAKGHRVVNNDFLKYHSHKIYDLIVMNPPFDSGDEHLLKALNYSTNIVCLLNAETIKNPFSNTRKLLLKKLEELEASIEYITDAFMDAERKTSVEVVLIKVKKKEEEYRSVICESLEKSKDLDEVIDYEELNQIVHGDYTQQAVEQFNYEVKLGVKLIKEFEAAKPYLNTCLDSKFKSYILELKMTPDTGVNINSYIQKVRYKYWCGLFDNPKFISRMPDKLRSKYASKIHEFQDYDFSIYNIKEIIKDMDKHLCKNIEETIMELFNDLSYKHYYDESSKNIHYFNGWKTNSSYKINKKVIIPLMGYADRRWSDGNTLEYDYNVKNKLTDIVKIFDYLDAGRTNDINTNEVLKMAESEYISQNIELKYFYATFYKKGTCHLVFKDDELLKKFNIFGSQRKGWLPPSYAKAAYNEMTSEEKAIVDSFEGAEEYNHILNNTDFYITKTEQLLLR